MMRRTIIAATLIAASIVAHAEDATFAVKSLTPETALTAARAALAQCRKDGYQVAVAVVDRSGTPQVFLRDRFAGVHTVDAALNKAWTAISFKIATATLASETQPGKPMSGLRSLPRVLAAGGGQVIGGGGSLFGGIGVSGAPGGEADDACAKAGLKRPSPICWSSEGRLSERGRTDVRHRTATSINCADDAAVHAFHLQWKST